MVRVFVFLAAVQLILVVLALISCLSADRVRAMPRAVWVLVILLIPLLGPAAYFLAGRPVSASGPAAGPAGPGRRPSNPDDDPEFLRSLNAEQARRDRELFTQWERDLRRREDELQRGDAEPDRADEPHRADEPNSSDEGRRSGRDDDARRRDNEDTPPTEV